MIETFTKRKLRDKRARALRTSGYTAVCFTKKVKCARNAIERKRLRKVYFLLIGEIFIDWTM